MDNLVLPYNKNLTLRRLENLEKEFVKDQLLGRKYSETINRYISKDYATKIKSTQSSQQRNNNTTNYIPQNGVINQRKASKWRVVFDDSAKNKGHSLNDYLLVRPNLINNLVLTIIRFRFGKYAAPGEQVFDQISASPKNRDALRFLWKENSIEVVRDYKMNIHLFRKNHSPYVANFAFKKTGTDKKDIIHLSLVTSIDQDFYMGDFLNSDNLVEHLTRITKSVISGLKESGFRLIEYVCQIIKTSSINYLKQKH